MDSKTLPFSRAEFFYKGANMDRVAIIGIIVENDSEIEKMNEILHEYSKYIIGRMGVPYHKRSISLISIMMDAPANIISALSGKLGMLKNISTKTIYSHVGKNDETAH